ncbi:hypothetical protein GCM10011297_35360 [Bacterioplanes sanyensis]|nr:hypothetical protein GCM10011297_35360 [Bacterioplanes sanyensis]
MDARISFDPLPNFFCFMRAEVVQDYVEIFIRICTPINQLQEG